MGNPNFNLPVYGGRLLIISFLFFMVIMVTMHILCNGWSVCSKKQTLACPFYIGRANRLFTLMCLFVTTPDSCRRKWENNLERVYTSRGDYSLFVSAVQKGIVFIHSLCTGAVPPPNVFWGGEAENICLC